jgi:general secretion pathway protein N
MRQSRLLILVGLVVFAAVVVATLPASLLATRLPSELTVEGASGTVWNGAADQIRLRGVALGTLQWSIQPAALLRAALAFRVEVMRPDGYVRGLVATTFDGALEGQALDLKLPITALHPEAAASAWAGGLVGHIEHVRLERGWPVELVGAFTIDQLRPPASLFAIGSYAIDFDGRANTATQLVGRVRDTNAPLLVRGQLEIRHERAYRLEGEVTPRPGADPDVSRAVAFLGTPDAAGRRSFDITGTF